MNLETSLSSPLSFSGTGTRNGSSSVSDALFIYFLFSPLLSGGKATISNGLILRLASNGAQFRRKLRELR